MTDEDIDAQLAAEMRLAFTRATVIFPKLINRDPITLAVYHIFSDVFYTLKRSRRWPISRELEPFESKFVEEITKLVDRAVSEISPKNVVVHVLGGEGVEAMKKYAPFIAGLSYPEAKMLYSLVKNKDPKASRQRNTMLRNRRNALANQLTADALKAAREYFLTEVEDARPDTG